MCQLKQLPELRELGQIPVPSTYQGQDPQRIRDFLAGFQIAWEVALRLQGSGDFQSARNYGAQGNTGKDRE